MAEPAQHRLMAVPASIGADADRLSDFTVPWWHDQ
jgi:hypothetical protein